MWRRLGIYLQSENGSTKFLKLGLEARKRRQEIISLRFHIAFNIGAEYLWSK
jgi:hypothetical protein